MKRFFLIIPVLLLGLWLGGCDDVECVHGAMSETIVAPTCSEEGYTLHQCEGCSFSYKTDLLPPSGHVMAEIVTAATCTDEGFTVYTCHCGYTYTASLTPPLGHTTETVLHAPTCTEAGYTEVTCTVCSVSYQTDHIDAKGHAFADQVLAPTCTEVGYTVRVCEICDFTYQSNYTDPLGHRFVKSITHPTRTEAGAFTHSCDCGYVMTEHLFYSDIFTGAFEKNTEVLAKGVDISVYQHKGGANGWLPLNWQAITDAGFEFAILKAGSTPRTTAGGSPLGGKDATFEMDYADAREAGMPLGAYFYTYATTPEAVRADAELLITWLKGKQFEYPIYFDLEDPSLEALGKDALTELCITFISTLQENGYYGALYSNNEWLINMLHGDSLKAMYDVWYARYPLSGNTPVSPDLPFAWNTEKYGPQLGMWQYTHRGTIEGIDDIEFDFNYVYRDYPSIIKKYGYNGFSVE